jgi:hypothetical protein
MFLHRRVFETYKFDHNFSMKGHQLKLGAETLLQERFLSENTSEKIFYEPRMEVAHFILPHKISLSYHARRHMAVGASRSRYEVRSKSLSFEVARALAHLCVSPLRTIFRDRTSYPYWQNYVYEKVIPPVMPVIGAALEKLRNQYQ